MFKTFLFLFFFLTSQLLFGQINLDTSSFSNTLEHFNIKESFVLIGEAHEVKGCYSTELFIINRLLKQSKNTLIIEAGISEACILNEYLNTGDEELLNHTRARGEHYKKFIQGIYTLHQEHPIKFIGVDFERSICVAYVLNYWFVNIDNEKLIPLKEKLLSINENTNAKKLKQLFLEIQSNFGTYEIELQNELGKNAKHLKDIIFNPTFGADYNFSSTKRDQHICQNIISIEKEQLKKSILIFGSNHFTNEKHFGYELKDQLATEIDPLLILLAFKNCKNFLKKKNYTSTEPLLSIMNNLDHSKDQEFDNLAGNAIINFSVAKDERVEPRSKMNTFIFTKIINQ